MERPKGSLVMGQAIALVHAGRDQPQNTGFNFLRSGWSWSSSLLPASLQPPVKHVLLADEIQIPELYETLSYRQSQAAIIFLTLPEQVCFPIS